MRRVAVTGIGVMSPLGRSAAEVFDNARAGRSAVRLIEAPFAARLLSPVAASVRDFDGTDDFDAPKLRMLDRVSQLALVAARQALDSSGDALQRCDPSRAGVFVGTGMGGCMSNDDGYQTLYGDASDRIKPYTVLLGMHNAPAGWISLEHGLLGPSLTYSTACASSAVAIGEAWLRVAGGSLDLALAGGAEAPLAFGSLKAWEALRTLATVDAADPGASCKPFSSERSGMVLGEGAAMLLLEPWEHALSRGATVHGELLGYGLSSDGGHITRPSVDGQAAAIRAALQSAAVAPSDIDMINAHGTGTVANDVAETQAIKQVFGERAARIPISATKALHGHLLGAAGALECVLSLLALQHATALPTMHLRSPDARCDLDYVANAAREGIAARTMISHSFAFGGTNAVLVLGAARDR